VRRHRLRALAIGAAVLVGIAWVVWQLFLRSRGLAAAPSADMVAT